MLDTVYMDYMVWVFHLQSSDVVWLCAISPDLLWLVHCLLDENQWDKFFFLGGGKHHLLSAFIRFCGKTANLSDIYTSSQNRRAQILPYRLSLGTAFFFLYVRDYSSISSIWSRCMLHLVGTALQFYLTQGSGHGLKIQLRPRSTARFTQSLFNPCKNLSSKKKCTYVFLHMHCCCIFLWKNK